MQSISDEPSDLANRSVQAAVIQRRIWRLYLPAYPAVAPRSIHRCGYPIQLSWIAIN
ncbi:hypothetical protein ACFQV5_13555 [Paenibacillus sp. GCM10028914]